MSANYTQDQNATIEIEKNILGNYISNPNVRSTIRTKLKHKDFLNNVNRDLFVIISETISVNDNVDETIIRANIINGPYDNKKELLERLSDITLEYTYNDNIDTLVDYLAKASIINKLKKFFDNEFEYLNKEISIDSLENYLEKKQSEFLDIINSRVTSDLKEIKFFVDDMIVKQEYIRNNRGKLTGVPSGIGALDDMIGGFQPGELIILAARPSIGKTALAINFAYNVATSLEDKTVVFYSLEMSSEQLIQRLTSVSSGINYKDFQNGRLTSNQELLWMKYLRKLENLNISISDNMNSTILDIQAGLRNLKNNEKKEISLIIVDYLQLINSHEKNGNRNQEVAKISRTLKMIAKELKVPVIAVAQLSRNIEQRNPDDRKPKLSDLRESGAIEQDADIVMFLDYDRTQTDKDKENKPNGNVQFSSNVIVDLTVAKNRNGETGIVKLIFNKKHGTYGDLPDPNRR